MEVTMNTINQRDFDKEAIQWDENPGRVKLARDVANAIIKTLNLQKNSNVLDFGCGTGLITMFLQPHVGSVTGVDSSKGMLGILEDKIKKNKLSNVFIQFMDFEKEEYGTGLYDLIVSNMTLHHVSEKK
jgi:tRNA (cmo5U34)-methyltransferase